MSHPIHIEVANAIEHQLNGRYELLRDQACGGRINLPLFIGTRKGYDTRMCCVDLLIVSSGQVRGIVEIEESGFLPTKICGKFLQAALATHFIHDSRSEGMLPYGEKVLFFQVLDGSTFKEPHTQKVEQARLIEHHIQELLPIKQGSITDYRLFVLASKTDEAGLAAVGVFIEEALHR
jgi:hypothetical protein